MKLKLIIASIFLLLMVGGAFGQKPKSAKTPDKPADAKPAKLPSAKKILAKYLQAIGGRAANEKFKTRLTKGTLEFAPVGIKGTFETYAAAPDKSYNKTNLQGIGEIVEGFDGTTAWSVNPIQGNRVKEGEELLQTKLISSFYRDTNLEKLYPKMEVKGTEKVGDKETYVVVATPNGLAPETFYFDVKSGLLVRSDMTVVSPEGKITTQTFYDDYREVDGVKTAYKMRAVLPQFEIITIITEIKNDVKVEDSLFAKPKA